MFAPTFRGDGNKDAYYPLEAFDVNHFMERQPEDTVLILKNHPFVKQKFTVDAQWQDRVLDLSGEEHINDLMLISNLLITDYSSSVFEAAILELPMLFYYLMRKNTWTAETFTLIIRSLHQVPLSRILRHYARNLLPCFRILYRQMNRQTLRNSAKRS